MLKKEVIKDFLGRDVKVGDTVVVLCKSYSYRGLRDARLVRTTYLGKGQWGYEFKNNSFTSKWFPTFRIKEPELIKFYSKKGGK